VFVCVGLCASGLRQPRPVSEKGGDCERGLALSQQRRSSHTRRKTVLFRSRCASTRKGGCRIRGKEGGGNSDIEGVVMAHAASSDQGQVSRLGREEDEAAATADADIMPSAGLPGATHMYESHPLPSVSTSTTLCWCHNSCALVFTSHTLSAPNVGLRAS